MAREDHVDCMVKNASVWVGRNVVEELGDVVIGEFGDRGLFGANFNESSK